MDCAAESVTGVIQTILNDPSQATIGQWVGAAVLAVAAFYALLIVLALMKVVVAELIKPLPEPVPTPASASKPFDRYALCFVASAFGLVIISGVMARLVGEGLATARSMVVDMLLGVALIGAAVWLFRSGRRLARDQAAKRNIDI